MQTREKLVDPLSMNAKVVDPNKIPFAVIVQFLEQVAGSKAPRKKELFRKFLDTFRPGTEFQALRLIFPEADSARGAYGLKEHTIGRIFADLLILPPPEKDRVLRWRDPNAQAKHNCIVGDFPSVLLSAIEPRMSSHRSESLTVGDLNKFLDDLYTSIDTESRKDLFQDIIYKATARQIKWIIKMILKDMKLGMGVESILRHLHPNAVQIYHMTSSLKQVLEAIAKPDAMSSADVTGERELLTSVYFQTFKPMLSERVNPGDIPERFGHMHGGMFLEPKLDGERMMVHVDKRNNRISIFSRNGVNFTKKYGEGQLSPILPTAFKGLGAVFDGEMVSWDPLKQRIRAFGWNREIGSSATSSLPESQEGSQILGLSEDGNLFYIIFDLVFYVDIDGNEFDLRKTELSSRKELLNRILLPVEHRIEAIHSKYIPEPSVDDIKEFLKNALDNKQEGAIVKRASSLYKLNVRGQGWYKIKADYDSTFTDTLDLVVLGGFFSDTSTGIDVNPANPLDAVTSFLVGVPKTSPEGTVFKTVTKVSTGLTRTQMVFLRNQLKHAVVPVPAGQLPEWLGDWKPTKSDRPDVFFDPFNKESSVVLEVNAGEILQSSEFSSGFQLRFPRIVRPRADKDWTDATSFDDLRSMATADRDNDRIFIQNLTKFERGYITPRSPTESKKRKKEIVIIEPQARAARNDTQSTLNQESPDDW